MPRPKKNTVPITMRLPASDVEKLQEWQDAVQVNTQQMIRWALYTFMDLAEADPEALENYELPESLVAVRCAIHSPRRLKVKDPPA